MKWLLCELLLMCSTAGEPLSVTELTYRTVLYEYYQDRYGDALVATLVAQEQGRTGEDPIRFELAKGSFAFKDGMYAYARETFDGVDPSHLDEVDHLRLAFHLARVHLQRQDWDGLAREVGNIDRIRPVLEEPFAHPELDFMRVELALAAGQPQDGLKALERLKDGDPLKGYSLYNIGVLQRQQGDLAGARQTLSALVELPVTSADGEDLAERARLALAYMARESEQEQNAESLLQALPAEGRYRDVALATYGNLAMRQEDHELAARIWLTLQQDEAWTASAAAARLGFPMSLHELAEPQTVLKHYQAAEQAFEQRLASLDRLNQQVRNPEWVRAVSSAFAQAHREPDSLRDFLESLELDIGHREWVEWLADESMHRLLAQWRELEDMKVFLNSLPGTLNGLRVVADEQHRRTIQASRLLDDDGLQSRRDGLSAELQQLDERLSLLSQPGSFDDLAWMRALASSDEQALLEEIEAMRAAASALPESERASFMARLDRLQGVAYYDMAAELPKRTWRLRRDVQQLEALLVDVDGRIARVRSAETHFKTGAGASYQGYADEAMRIIAEVLIAQNQREALLAELMQNRLERENQRITQYLFVTRVAIARTTDQLAAAVIAEGDS